MTIPARLNSKNLYLATLAFSLIILLINAWDAPVSGDEFVHLDQAEKNIRYFQSHGDDTSALHTPISRLKHYGQSFDNVTTLIVQVFSIKDVYRFRHLANSFVAWLVILFTSFTTIHLTKSKWAGLIAVILMLLTARFMGHAMNNLKDIPFAFSFIFSIFCMLKFLEQLPVFAWKYIVGVIFGLAFGISIRIGGLLIYAYFILFSFLWIYFLMKKGELKWDFKWMFGFTGISVFILVAGYLLGIVFWPWAWEAPFTNPIESLALIKNYPTTVRQVFEGELFWSDQFPWYYLIKYLFITLPLIVLLGFIGGLVLIPRNAKMLVKYIFLLIAFGFPLFYAIVTDANVYGGWRQMLFVFPPLAVLSAYGIWEASKRLKKYRVWLIVFALLLMSSMGYPAYYSITNYPYQYTFFNVLQGGFKGAYGQYELDYYFTGFQEAYRYLDSQTHIKPEVIATNFFIPSYYKGEAYKARQIDYYNRSADNWDYAIICNTFLNPWQLQNGFWPPANTIHQVKIEEKPIVAILKRGDELDFDGIQLLRKGHIEPAITKLEIALSNDSNNESILINLARAYFRNGNKDMAYSTLNSLFRIYPKNEWGQDLKGEILMEGADFVSAIEVFQANIKNNYKFFHSYVNLAKAYHKSGNEQQAITELKKCLRINPFYQPAYQLYGSILIEQGELELGRKMLEFEIKGNSKYGRE